MTRSCIEAVVFFLPEGRTVEKKRHSMRDDCAFDPVVLEEQVVWTSREQEPAPR